MRARQVLSARTVQSSPPYLKSHLNRSPSNVAGNGLTAFVSGGLFVTICLRTPGVSGGGPLRFVLLSFVVLMPVTLALVRYSRRDSWLIAPLVVIGVVVGIMIDVALDTKEDRNLFPIEIVVACALATPPVVAGAALGWLVKKKVDNGGSAEKREHPLQDGQRQ